MVTANDAGRASRSGARGRGFGALARAAAALCALLLPTLAARPAAAWAVKRTSGGAVVHWREPRLDVRLGASRPSGIDAGPMVRAARRAARAWQLEGAPELVVSSEPAPDLYAPGAPGVAVVVQRPWPHAQGLLATTMTLYDDRSGALLDADVLINPAARLTVLDDAGGDPSRWDLQSLLTHELGHVLGLGESPDDPAATMWARLAAGDLGPRTLARDDRDGLSAIYDGRPLAAPASCARGTVAAPGARPEALAVLAILAALLGIAAHRRRAAPPLAFAGALLLFFYWPSGVWSAEAPRADVGEDAEIVGVFVGEDGLHWTRVRVGDQAFEIPGGCVDGICMRFGDEDPTRPAPATHPQRGRRVTRGLSGAK